MTRSPLLDRLLTRYGPRPRAHAVPVVLAALGALAVAWELPSPDHAVPGLWAAILAAGVVLGSARFSLRAVVPLGVTALLALGAVGVAARVLADLGYGGWPLLLVGAVSATVGRLIGGPGVFSVGPLWLVTPGS